MSHPNAPLTIEGRRRLVVRFASGVPIAHVAAQMGVSRVTASKWWHRYKDGGGAGLGDRLSRPHHCPGALEARWAEEIEGMRRTHKWSAARINSRTRSAPKVVRHPSAHCGSVARAPRDQPQEGPGPHGRGTDAARAPRRGGHRAGCTYLHSMIDGFSRLAPHRRKATTGLTGPMACPLQLPPTPHCHGGQPTR